MSLVYTIRQDISKSLSTTPGTMTGQLIMVALCAILFVAVSCFAVAEHREALQRVCWDSAPSMKAAQDIRTELADMDANAANELIAAPGKAPDAVTSYNQRRQEVGASLVTAAKNITFDGEEDAIRAIETGLGDYEALVTRARVFHEQNSSKDIDTYLDATKLMHEKLLPAADKLDEVNGAELKKKYDGQEAWAWATSIANILAGGLLLGALIRLQRFLSNKMRRTFNVMLLVATALTVLFLGMLLQALIGSAQDLKGAKEDAFDSIDALSKARATAYDANGEESRWLLTRAVGKGEEFEKAFVAKSDQVVRIPTSQTYDAAIAACKAAGQRTLNHGTRCNADEPGMSGMLKDELHNITFPGEIDVALQDVSTWGTYMKIDGQIRSLENKGQHQEAVDLCCGSQVNQSNWAFNNFDASMLKTIDINTKFFEQYRQSGMDRLAWFEPFSMVIAASVFILAFVGLRPRFQEYAT